MIYASSFLLAVKQVTNQLATGRFADLVRDDVLTEQEVADTERNLAGYGEPFGLTPDDFWTQIFVSPVGYEGETWDLMAPLYLASGELSDMQAQFRMTRRDGQIVLRLHTVLVR